MGGFCKGALVALAAFASALALTAGAAEGEPAVEPAPSLDGEFEIGVVPQGGELDASQVELMSAAGIGSVRFWLPWSGVEAERDELNWTSVDRIVRITAIEGLDVLPFIFGSPEWAANRDGYECAGFACIPYAPASIETRYGFARFAAAAVRRYGPKGSFWENNPGLPYRPIRTWQVWNEPNLESFYRPDVDPLAYAELVELTAEEIRSEDPGAEIVLGGLSGSHNGSKRESTQRFLRHLYAIEDIAASFDAIAVHPYDPRVQGVISQIETARAVVVSRDPGAQLWITEIGWASAGKRRWNLVKSRQEQARLLRRVFGQFLERAEDWNLREAYWYAWRDTERGQAVCGWCPAAGLIDREGRAKPAYDELRLLTQGQ